MDRKTEKEACRTVLMYLELIICASGHGMNCLKIARNMECYESIAFLDAGCVGEAI